MITPTNRHILVTKCTDPRTPKQRDIIFDAPQPSDFGLVVAVDPTPYRVPPGQEPPPAICKVGDVVYYPGNAMFPVVGDDDVVYALVHETQVKAVWPDSNAKATNRDFKEAIDDSNREMAARQAQSLRIPVRG